MEKLSKLGQFGKKVLLPAAMMGMLNFALAANTPKNKGTTTLDNKQATYLEVNFSEKKSLDTFKKIIESDLNAMTGYNKLEVKVQNEIVGLMTDEAADTLATSEIYKTKEQNTITNGNMSTETMERIAQNRGKGTSDKENIVIAGAEIQHYIHLALMTKEGVLFNANEIVLNALDEKDGKNEYLSFDFKGKRSVRDESDIVMSTLAVNIFNYVNYYYSVKGQDNENIVNVLKTDFSNLQKLLSKEGKLTEDEYNESTNIIIHIATVLPADLFGTLSMRVALVTEFAKTYSRNKLIDLLGSLGYDVNNFKAGNFVKEKSDITFSPFVNATGTNQHVGANLGLAINLPLVRNWDLSFGAEGGYHYGINSNDNITQFLGSAETGYTTKNNKHRLNMGLQGGIQFNGNNLSTPFGVKVGYQHNFNKKVSLNMGASGSYNMQRAQADALGFLSLLIKTDKINLIFSVQGGYTFDLNKTNTNSITPTPQPTPNPDPTEPEEITNEDEVVTPEDTTDLGPVDEYPQQPIDKEDLTKLY